MSEYDYDVAPRRRRTHRSTREREPEYVEETTYIQRGPGRASTDLVFRGREDSVEDIQRDFPPPGAEYRRTKYREDYAPRQTRSVGGRRGYDYDDDYYSDYGPAGAGGAAGYAASRRNGRRHRGDDYYSDYDDRYDRPRRERRKSKVEELIEGAGLGGVVAAITGKDRSRSRSRGGRSRSRRRSDSDRSFSDRSRSRDNRRKWQQAAKAAVITGVVEAVRSRNEPGPWAGAKGQRVATAALGAAGIDGFLDKDPDRKSKRHIVESVIGGLAANRLANGPRDRSSSRGRSVSRSRSRSRTGLNLRNRSRSLRSRSRSLFGRGRSRSRGGSDVDDRGGSGNLKNVAALGGIAAAGKAIYDRVRSKSRNRNRSRSSSEDSYVPTRRQRYGRDRGPPPDPYDEDERVARTRDRAPGGETAQQKRDGSTSSVSTTDLENQRKRTRGKELLTAGLATVATIHAAHGVYSSMVASEKRHKMVLEGEISAEEARKRKSKNMLQDAAAVGIAALGIKSAFSEWKEMNEQRHSVHEIEERRRKRRKAREKRAREMRQAGFGAYPGNAGYPYPVTAGPTAYADGNPYGAAGLPPPPMGVAQQAPAPRY